MLVIGLTDRMLTSKVCTFANSKQLHYIYSLMYFLALTSYYTYVFLFFEGESYTILFSTVEYR